MALDLPSARDVEWDDPQWTRAEGYSCQAGQHVPHVADPLYVNLERTACREHATPEALAELRKLEWLEPQVAALAWLEKRSDEHMAMGHENPELRALVELSGHLARGEVVGMPGNAPPAASVDPDGGQQK